MVSLLRVKTVVKTVVTVLSVFTAGAGDNFPNIDSRYQVSLGIWTLGDWHSVLRCAGAPGFPGFSILLSIIEPSFFFFLIQLLARVRSLALVP